MQAKLAQAIQLIKEAKPASSSEKALAESLLQALVVVFENHVVFTGGEGIYVYDKEAGLWKQLDDNKLFSMALHLDGKWVAKRSKISMSAAKAAGIVRCFKQLDQISKPDFFADALNVIALQNTVLSCSKNGVTEVVAAPEHKLRFCLPHKYDAKVVPKITEKEQNQDRCMSQRLRPFA